MPDLGAEVFPAVAAFQLCRERAAAVMAPPRVLPPLYLRLHELPLRRLDDGVMAALHVILRHLPMCTNFTKNIEVAVGRFFVFQ